MGMNNQDDQFNKNQRNNMFDVGQNRPHGGGGGGGGGGLEVCIFN